MAENFEPATDFFTSLKRLEKKTTTKRVQQQRQNTHYYTSMNIDEHLSGFFVKNYLESVCDATNLSAILFLFHCSDYDF